MNLMIIQIYKINIKQAENILKVEVGIKVT